MNHFYFNVPGWFGFQDVYDRAIALLGKDGAHFVEVGCWEGRSAAYMGVGIVNSGRKIRFDCIDTWEDAHNEYDYDIDGNITMTAGSPKISGKDTFRKFLSNISVFKDLADIRPIRKKSVEAAADYEDGSIDFVFLDASHNVQDLYNDISAWLPKLKVSQGVIAGDDAEYIGVRVALIKSGLGVPDNPVVMSGGSYKSWIYTPFHMQKSWVSPKSVTEDFSSLEGHIQGSQERLRQVLGINAHE